MRGSEAGGKCYTEEIAALRARVAELERVNRRLTRGSGADEDLNKDWAEWKRTFDATRDSVMILDGDFRIVQANLATLQLLGRPLEEIIGQTCWKIVHGTEAPYKECPLRVAQKTAKHEEAELYVAERNMWVEVSVDPILDDQGHTTRAIHIVRDVTERRRTREREKQHIRELEFLSESAAAFAQFPLGADLCGYIAGRLKELVPDAIVAVNSYERESGGLRVRELLGLGGHTEAVIKLMGANPVGRCFEIDDQAREGLARGELVKVPGGIYDLSPGIPKVVCQAIEKLLGLGDVYGTGLSWKGQLLGSIIILTRSRDELSNRSFIETFIRQAAVALQRAEAERALRESDARIEAAIDAACLGTWDWNLTTGQIVWAGHHERLFGFAPEEFDGRYETFESRIHPDDVDGLRQAVERSLRERADYAHEYRVVWPDGTMHWMAGRGRYRWDQMGRPTRMLGIVSDITDRKRAEEAYRSLVDHSLQGLAIFQDGRIVFANEAMAEITGYTVQEMLEAPPERVQAFVHPEDREMVWRRHEQRLNGQILPERYEIRGIRKDGSVCRLDIQASTIEYQGMPAIQAAYVDVTENRKAAESLRESEQRLKILFESAPDGIYLTDLEGNFIDGNRMAEKLAGYAREELIGRNFAEAGLLWPHEIPKAIASLGKVAAGEPAGPDEFTLRRKDGTQVVVEIRTYPVRINDQDLSLGIARDITERKKAEHLLRKERDKAQQYLDIAAVMMIAIDSEQRVGLINDKGCEILGYAEEEILGKNWFDHFLPERVRAEVRAVFEKFVSGQTNAAEYFENPILTKDGRERLIAWHNTTLKDGQGGFVATLSSGEDITERRRIEEVLRQSEEKHRDLFENAREAILAFDPKGNITDANKLVEDYGFKRKELIGKSFLDYTSEAHRTRAVEDFETLISGRPVRGEMDVVTPKGTITVEYSDNPIFREGKVVGVQAILMDVTERKKAVEALKRQTLLSQVFLDSMPCVALLLRSQTREIVAANRQAEEIGAVPGTMCYGAWAKRESPCPWCLAPEVWNTGESRHLVVEYEGIIWDAHWVPIEEDLYLHYAFDVTERKKAEEQIRNLAKFPAENPYPIMRISGGGTVLFANPASTALLRDTDSGVGRPVPSDWRQAAQSALASGSVGRMEVKHAGRILAFRAVPVINTGYVNFYGTDITDRKKAEERLLEYQAKLRAMASEVLRAEDRERRRLALELHDNICQRLALTKLAVESSLPLVSNARLAASLRIAAGAIGETIEEADSLTFELSSPVLREFGLVPALEKYLTEEVRRKHEIAYELESDEQIGALPEETKSCLFRVMRELLMNVVKHARANKIKVSVRKSQGQLRLSVCDDGIGFKREEVNWEVSKKARFGLFSVREQLEYLGGSLEVESEPGRGTTAIVVVPLAGETTL
jgi:PAS domain S-box-containing protein